MDLGIDISLLPKRGDTAFVHYYHEPTGASQVCKNARGSPFKSIVKARQFKPEGIMYTVAHVTDNTIHEAHISDFVTMGWGCYAKMKRIARADAAAHTAWQAAVEQAETQLAAAQTQPA